MPGPTFRPFLVALGARVLFLGLVFGGWILLFGVVFTIIPLLGWLNDARKEYRQTVEADETGHVVNEPAPALAEAAVLGDRASCSSSGSCSTQGWFPPQSASGETGERLRRLRAARRPVRRAGSGGPAAGRSRRSSPRT